MTWFEILRLATQLVSVITPIIGQALRHGDERADVSALPVSVQQKVVKLAEQVQAQ